MIITGYIGGESTAFKAIWKVSQNFESCLFHIPYFPDEEADSERERDPFKVKQIVSGRMN